MAAAGAAAQAPDGASADAPPFVLGPADVLRVWVWQNADLGATVVVTPDGKVSVPLAGELEVAGRTRADVEAELTERFRTYLGEPVVTLVVEQVNSSQISVLGQVGSPGRYPLLQPLSIVDAVALAGGFGEFANTGDVTVIRTGPDGVRHIRVDVEAFLRGGQGRPFMLQPGDAVYIR